MKHAAVDVGANGGTVVAARITPDRVDISEVHRFDNRPVKSGDRYVWDVDGLLGEITTGLAEAERRLGDLGTVGVDTWGLDFGLIRNGELLRAPTSYRDPAVCETRDDVISAVGKRSLFDATGLTHWNTPNTLWQYHTLATVEPDLLANADRLLMMPQLLSFLLGGDPVGEVTVASTTQMIDPQRRAWATSLLDRLSLPADPLPPLREPGASLGRVSAADLSSNPELLAPASHDTAAAVAGMPLDDDAAFLSTGSWFILGLTSDRPVRSRSAYEADVSNELGFNGTVRLLRNVNGFFLLEECREVWDAEGKTTDYDELLADARDAPERASLVDPDAEAFGIETNIPESIAAYCRDTGQRVPETEGEIVRCILESLAGKTALALDAFATAVDRRPSTLHVGGGGVRNRLFCRLLADATALRVRAGPTEATAVGNLLTQAVAAGSIPDLAAGHRLVESTVDVRTYEPRNTDGWTEAKERLRALPTE